ncbi:hypothetical protein Cni_G12714 [Canna indica]|uniref:Eukaryotic translation initiation factor 3 subunit J n=1 Tax=Canna indica TaxID=4628 RepID=A0AAQ3K8B7_9LILI|nr:hypothetical protein Cni_G12714 [Canna indica]
MADWEDDDFEPAAPALINKQPKNQWDDEDVDDENVKESWEDEEELVQAPKAEQVLETSAAKAGRKGADKKEELPEAKTGGATSEVLADPVAEKLRQQRLVEEADYKSTAELFAKKGGDKTLDNFIPKSENDFMEYAELLSHKIRPYEKSFHYMGLLKAVMRLSMASMKGADAKELASTVTAIANEKIKAEKEANAGKKKQGAKKKQLHVERGDDDFSAAGGYDDVDDYDFM